MFLTFLPLSCQGEAGSGLAGPTGVKHPTVPSEQGEFRGLEHQDAELGVNKFPVGTRFGLSVGLTGSSCLEQLCSSWNVGRNCAKGEIGYLGSSRRFSVCL